MSFFYSEAPPIFGEAKVVKIFELDAATLKFCSTSVRNPYFTYYTISGNCIFGLMSLTPQPIIKYRKSAVFAYYMIG